MFRKTIYLLLLAIVTGCSGSGSPPRMTRHSEAKLLFGTVVQIDVCTERGQEDVRARALQEVWDRLEGIHWRMGAFDPRSDVAKINSSYNWPVQVGEDTYMILKVAEEIRLFTEKNFDIAVKPVMDLLREAAEEGNVDLLFCAETKAAHRKAMEGKVVRLLPDRRVEVLTPDTQIDLGGIAKGYAVDEASRILREYGFRDFLIDADGDLYAGGRNCQRRPWRIEIKDPRDATTIFDVVEISDLAMSTTSRFLKYFLVEGEKYAPLILRRGVPILLLRDYGGISTTVIAPTALYADGWATGFFFFTEKARMIEMFDASGGSEAILYVLGDDAEYRTRKIKSRGWNKYSVMK